MILRSIILILFFAILMFFFFRFIINKIEDVGDAVSIIDGTKNTKHSVVITQNPRNKNSITLYRSDNEDKGIEFSYVCWFIINEMDYKFGEWKHMFHKGNKSSYPNRAPGVFIHETENKLRIYMNTLKDILEFVDIENIPLKKWVHLGIVVDGQFLDVYINGKLRTRYKMKGLPKQNYGDLWVNLFGGFDGYLSNLSYYRKALSYMEIEDIVRKGPSKKILDEKREIPPYLEDSWFQGN